MRLAARCLVACGLIGGTCAATATHREYVRPGTAQQGAELLEELCAHVSAYAESVMRVRLDGLPLDVAIKRQRRISGDAGIGGVLQEILIDTYNTPLVAGHAQRTTTISEFSNKWYTVCKQQDRFVGLSRSPLGTPGK